ncbi:MAG TPA: HD domain-containing phosphohydrolase [Acidimicrobiia bacterium]|jgi:HD-GYP domain-containing protein (c-di-GMP phosphodiesterase class II)|nr:HD domain-containing phosphohydrolase [Acidimicrobiia bacterium]HYJ23683.1 HD domain-containing phosphohydrolase [Acidimicrobiia bacterium]
MRELPRDILIEVMEDVIEDLHGHVHRVSDLAVNLGIGIGLGEIDLDRLALAGVLHDVGKIHLDPGILGKPGPLDPTERELMNRHPELGFAMTRNRLDPKVAEAILYHHERYDGRGYPFGLGGEEIPILSRIILVADAFDAITSTRSYQIALPVEFAVNEIRKHAGTQFDPHVVDLFLELAAINRLPLELSA